MTRKLLRTMTALSATATVSAVLLLAARPLAPAAPAPSVLTAGDAAPMLDVGADADPSPALRQRHQLHRARVLLALPYFSFAQGLRRSRS